MGGKSSIEWTDATWNPVTGCTKVSQGCKHCYAERLAPKVFAGQVIHGGSSYGPTVRRREFTDVLTHPVRLDQPLRWRKPRRIFVNSMSDLFHEDVPDDFLDHVFTTMRRCEVMDKGHIFQVLTKRPRRMLEFMQPIPTPRNLWLGVSIEDQATADERIPLLLQTPAAVRFVSYEPALGPIRLDLLCAPADRVMLNGLTGKGGRGAVSHFDFERGIDWLIAGGESGPHARPAHPDWFRSARDQCASAGVAFFFKQWGEWTPCLDDGGHLISPREQCIDGAWMLRVGKKSAGRELDGRTHDEYPA